ncbi:MAG: hypothetical protein H7338_19450 [Candidatus Sericytochromatia bacterium]|nr:hypothetical protein [Candidatus Sericytochromatia bacterium]
MRPLWIASLAIVCLVTGCAAGIADNRSAAEEMAEGRQQVIVARNATAALYARPVVGNLKGVELHLWRSIKVTIRNTSPEPINLDPIGQFVLLSDADGSQSNALAFADLTTNLPAPRFGLGPNDRLSMPAGAADGLGEAYLTRGPLLPGATKTGYVFFRKPAFNEETVLTGHSLVWLIPGTRERLTGKFE